MPLGVMYDILLPQYLTSAMSRHRSGRTVKLRPPPFQTEIALVPFAFPSVSVYCLTSKSCESLPIYSLMIKTFLPCDIML